MVSEEDTHLEYLNDYKQFIKFSQGLREQLKGDISQEKLITRLSKDLKKMKLSHEEQRAFESEEKMKKLLKSPLLEIVMTIKEQKHIQEKMAMELQKEVDGDRKVLNMKGKINMKRATDQLLD